MKLITIILLLSLGVINTQAQVGTWGRFGLGGIPSPTNIPPVANAGTNVVITLPTNSTGLTGSGTSALGYIAGYFWRQISGTSVTITTPLSSYTQVGFFVTAGTYSFELTVTDNVGATGKDTVSVIVNSAANIPPIAFAGPNQSITLPTNSITFAGSGTDADGTIVSYQWSKASGTAGGTIVTPSSATSTVINLTVGTNNYFLTCTDNNGAVGIAAMTVTVLPAAATNDGSFAFTVTGTNTHTSAGVYRNDSVLVKTIWSDSIIAAGSYTGYWNGTDDLGLPIVSPDATYKVKVQSNNAGYTWQGTIGNTSDSMTGLAKHRGYNNGIMGLAIYGSYGYYCTGYSEAAPSFSKFNTATPNQRIIITVDNNRPTADVTNVCTDGTKVYWAGLDGASVNNSFVFGTNVSDDAYVTFLSGSTYTPLYRAAVPVICYKNQPNSAITGIAVNGTYLFVARAGLNIIEAYNKTTGAFVVSNTLSSPSGLSTDGSGNLWAIVGGVVKKYSTTSGILTNTLTLSGTVSPQSTQVSFDGTTVSVCDAGTSQQVKFYNNSTGAATGILGAAGGYTTDATVTNGKFYFSDPRGNKPCGIAYQSDGSFWVTDFGNSRVQKYNSSNTWTNRIMFLGSTYSVYIDRGNINKLFAGYLEFSVDYSVQTLTGTTGWALAKNWGATIPITVDDFGKANWVTTLSNGRTYGLVRIGNNNEVIEFVSGGVVRFTGVIRPLSDIIATDGYILRAGSSGGNITYTRYALTGFTSNNPNWSASAENLGSALESLTVGTPSTGTFGYNSTVFKSALYNPYLYSNLTGPVIKSAYSLGIIQKGTTNTYLFQTEKVTHRSYKGEYPKAGFFEIGNMVNNAAGSTVNIVDSNIITAYHGEFWKNGQTNKFNHYYLTGLALRQFGTTRWDVGTENAPYAEMAGNALSPIFVKTAGDSGYLYHGDESDHSAIARWKISNLSSVRVQSITVNYPTAYVAPSINYTPLLSGVPWDIADLPNNTAGWTRNPTVNSYSSQNWEVSTSLFSYDQLKDNDIAVKFSNPSTLSVTDSLSKGLGNNNVTTNWKVTGNLGYYENDANYGATFQYFEVLDNSYKVLTTFYPERDLTTYPNVVYRLKGNTTTLYTVTETGATFNKYLSYLRPFEVSCVSGTITFTYGAYSTTTTISDGTADWHKPFKIRARYVTLNNGYPVAGAAIQLRNLNYFGDY